jgi:alanine racemase
MEWGARGTLNNWIEVSDERLTANFHALQAAAGPETTILAVIKANAYGHGAERCAPTLVRAGATWLGVTSAGEGARVRQALEAAHLEAEILIMCGSLPEDAHAIHEHTLTPVVWTAEQIESLRDFPGTRVQVEVDTGMGRQGVEPGPALDDLLARIADAGLIFDGIFTHFCSAEVGSSPLTALQQQRFEGIIHGLLGLQSKPTWIHAGNSSALDNPAPHIRWITALASQLGARAMVRTGLALYGYCLPIENAGHAGLPRVQPSLKPVLTWKTRVLAVRALVAGDTVGYNATFTAESPARVALLGVGYADGLRRELSSTNDKCGGWVMLHRQRAPILGRISMNLTVVDVSDIPEVAGGDEAILLGDGITAEPGPYHSL